MENRLTLRAAVCAALLGISTLTACGDEAPTNSRPMEAPVEGIRVELLNAGEAPHQPVVWFTDPEEQKVAFSVTRGLEQHTENAPDHSASAPASSPTPPAQDLTVPYEEVTMNLPLKATSSTDGDTRTNTVTVGRPSGDNADRNEDVASAEGFVMTTKHDLTGRATTRSFAAPDSASNSARASVEEALTHMNNLPVVFPQEPIGPGASWKVSNRVEDGVSLIQDITYTLKERQNKTVTLAVSVERRPATRNLADTDLRVLKAESESSGQISVNLTRPLPERGSVNVSTSITYGQEGSPTRVVQRTTSKTTWSPGGDPL